MSDSYEESGGSRFGSQVASRFLFVIKRIWWVMLMSALLGAVLGVAWSLLQTPKYEATVRLYVTSGTNVDAQSAYQGNLASQQRVASYVELVTSDTVVQEALAQARVSMSADDVKASLKARVVPDTVLMEISARDAAPVVAQELANAIGESMVEAVEGLETPDSENGALAKLTVVSPAKVSDQPVTPQTTRNAALGGLFGLIVGLIVGNLQLRLDTKLRSESDLVAEFPVPCLGVVPYDNELQQGAAAFSSGASTAAEAYRRLRANLQFVGVDSPARVILVTSPNEGEGKTTTAINLAASIADAGERVVLVSGDLRKPGLSERISTQSGVGFTDFLVGSAKLPDLVQPAGVGNFDLLGAGALPPNPAELLGSERAKLAFEELSVSYDYVVIDSAPILPVVDSVVLASFADGVILVVRSGQTSKSALQRAVVQLDLARVRVLGTVLNDVRAGENVYRYAYSGHSKDVGVSNDAPNGSVDRSADAPSV